MDIYVIGIGPGNPELLTIEAKQAIDKSTVLVGDARMVASAAAQGKHVYTTYKADEIIKIAETHRDSAAAMAVLVSGDVGFFSLASRIRTIPGCRVIQLPGISSLVYFAAKLQTSWHDAYIVSRHGRKASLVMAVRHHDKVFCLTGRGDDSVSALCRELSLAGLGDAWVQVGIDLSYDTEKIISATAEELAQQDIDGLAVMMIYNEHTAARTVHGLADDAFLRGKTPMTKEEIRSIILSKLRPTEADTIYDIGAGTGSCSVELALQAPRGTIYSLEIDDDALALLEANKRHFGLTNMTIVPGNAAETIGTLPTPQRAFIGGTKGQLAVILDEVYRKNPTCSIVMTAITIETLAAITTYYASKTAYELDIVHVSIAKGKKIGMNHLMMAQNPIYIVTARPIAIDNKR